MRKRKPRHSKQNVIVNLSAGTLRVMTRERYTDMINRSEIWRKNVFIVCVIPYPSPELFQRLEQS